MGSYFLGISFLIFSFLVIFAFWYFLSSRKKQRQEKEEEFLSAVIEIIEGRKEKAMEILKNIALTEPNDIYSICLLGDLLREKGELKRALKLHLPLLARKGIDQKTQARIMKSVALDYHFLGDEEKAVETAEKGYGLDSSDPFFIEFLADSYERLSMWEKALEMVEQLEQILNIPQNKRKAYIRLGLGMEQVNKNDGHRARILFKEAIKEDNGCYFAYKLIADSYAQEKRWDEAIDWYKKLIELFPDKSYIALPELEKTFFEKGNFQEIIDFYRNILFNDPENKYVAEELANIYVKMGNYSDAIKVIESITSGDDIRNKIKLIKYYKELDDTNRISSLINELFTLISSKNAGFICKDCGIISDEELWRCPQCKGVYTFQKK